MLFSFTSSIYPSAAYQQAFTQNTPDMNMQRYSNPLAESEKLKVRKWTRLFIRNRDCRRRLDTESDKVSYSDTYDKDTSLMSRVTADVSLCGRHLSLHTNKWVSFSQLLSLTNNCPLVLRPSCSEWNSSDQISTQKLPQRWWERDIQVSIMYRNILVTFVLLFCIREKYL